MNDQISKLSTSEIIKRAYSTQEEETYWNLIASLHKRGNKEVFIEAESLTKSNDPINREIGADILGQLGWSSKNFQKESVLLLISLLKDEVPDVIASAAFSLGHRNAPQSIPFLLPLINHPNADVRHGVTLGLSGLDDADAVAALIMLSMDNDFDVRNWATFALGSQCDFDSKKLRLALQERLGDKEPEIRGEAFIGLARRKDISIVDKLKEEVSKEFHGIWAVEACSYIPHIEFIPLLEKLLLNLNKEDKNRFGKEIKETIETCKKNT